MHDRAAAGKRVGGGTRGRGDDEAVAAVRVHVGAVDPGLEVDHAAGFALGDHDVVERERSRCVCRPPGHARLEQHAPLGLAAAVERVVDALRASCSGPTSVRKPSRPRLMPSTRHVGGRRPCGRRAAACRRRRWRRSGRRRAASSGSGTAWTPAPASRQRLVRDDADAVARCRAGACASARMASPTRGSAARPAQGDTGLAGWACVHGWPAF